MNHTYIKNATWAPNGAAYDFRLSLGGCGSTPCIDGLPLTGVDAIAPAGTMDIPAGATSVIDATGKLILPALFDLHAKVEIQGRNKREAISRAGQAAQQGGVWGMVIMPTKGFVFDNAASLDFFRHAVTNRSVTEMMPAGCITMGCEGEQQAPYNTLAARGVNILSDGEHVPSNLLMLHRAMKYAAELGLTFAIRGDVPALTEKTYAHPSTTSYRLGLHGTPACAEEIGIETVLRLAADAGAKVHIQTVSTAEGVAIIRRAKASGKVKVTAEVALHHLLYTHEDIGDYDTTFKVVPPLRDAADRDALLAGVKDGTIDCIVSDHTPCIPFAKKQDFISAPQGMTALDFYLPTLYTELVKPGKLTWAELVRACCTAPAAIAAPADDEGLPAAIPLLLFDPAETVTVSADNLPSGTLNTPLLGKTVCGGVTLPL